MENELNNHRLAIDCFDALSGNKTQEEFDAARIITARKNFSSENDFLIELFCEMIGEGSLFGGLGKIHKEKI